MNSAPSYSDYDYRDYNPTKNITRQIKVSEVIPNYGLQESTQDELRKLCKIIFKPLIIDDQLYTVTKTIYQDYKMGHLDLKIVEAFNVLNEKGERLISANVAKRDINVFMRKIFTEATKPIIRHSNYKLNE